MLDTQVPQAVVGVLVFKGEKILLGKRKRGDGVGDYAGPGGHLRFGETLEECAIRKVLEEAGIEITNVKIVSLCNVLKWEGGHYIDIEAVADWVSGEPEPTDKSMIGEWNWYDLENLPSPLIVGDQNGLDAIKSRKFYFGTVSGKN